MDSYSSVPVTAAGAAAELELLRVRRRPTEFAPVQVWVAYLLRHADLWEVLAAFDATLAPSAEFVATFHRKKAKELQEQYQPTDQWPGARSW